MKPVLLSNAIKLPFKNMKITFNEKELQQLDSIISELPTKYGILIIKLVEQVAKRNREEKKDVN